MVRYCCVAVVMLFKILLHCCVCIYNRCQECRSHFLEMYSACDNDRCKIPKPSNVRRGRQTPEEEPTLALWVWRMHNAVNARLAQEGDEEVEVYR